MIKPLNGAPPFTFQPIIKSIEGCNFVLSPTKSDHLIEMFECDL